MSRRSLVLREILLARVDVTDFATKQRLIVIYAQFPITHPLVLRAINRSIDQSGTFFLGLTYSEVALT